MATPIKVRPAPWVKIPPWKVKVKFKPTPAKKLRYV